MLKETWKPRIDGVDIADASAVNEIAEAVIEAEEQIEQGTEKLVQALDAIIEIQNVLMGGAK
jgi:hypothetical protein